VLNGGIKGGESGALALNRGCQGSEGRALVLNGGIKGGESRALALNRGCQGSEGRALVLNVNKYKN
jgi:hypothetical protein